MRRGKAKALKSEKSGTLNGCGWRIKKRERWAAKNQRVKYLPRAV